jgi:serine/threonine protein kinase/tetratricopeptide (TPR) repeat protein
MSGARPDDSPDDDRLGDAQRFFARLAGVVDAAAAALSADELGGADAKPSDSSADAAADALLGQLVGHYRIEARLGEGGMGVVYRAFDTRLQRRVVLKFLPTHLVANHRAKERFLVEARAVAALDHPNICAIYEVSDTEGPSPFIAMGFYPGRTLAQLLSNGPLPWRTAVDYAIQIARGLAAAHDRGIVHRDVKPANIVVTTDGVVKLLDFGIARVRDVAMTEPGLTPGTIAYMSPEQAAGRPVDARTDLWSLGVVLHEMSVGVRPFRAESTAALESANEEEPRAHPSTSNGDVPQAIGAIVSRLLEKEPAARYGNANALLTDLALVERSESVAPRMRRPPSRLSVAAIAAVVVLAATLGTIAWQLRQSDSSVDTRRVAQPNAVASVRERIIVADFANATSDSTLGDVIAHVLRNELARSPLLGVIGPDRIAETMRRMRVVAETPLSASVAREVAAREEIKAVVVGDVRRVMGTGLVLSAQLIEVASGDVIHAASVAARDSTEVLAVIERLSNGIRQGIGESLASIQAGDSLWSFTTSSLPALRKHMAGSRANLSGEFLRSVELLEQAIALDPDFAYAHRLLAAVLGAAGLSSGRVTRSITRAYALRDRVTDRERWTIEGHYHLWVTGDLTQAIAAFRKHIDALKQFPMGEPGHYTSFATALEMAGDVATAEAVLEEGRVRFPSAANQTTLIHVLHAQGKDAEAREVLADISQRLPEHPRVLRAGAALLADSGRYEQAHALAARMRRDAGLHSGLQVLAEVDAVRGRLDEAVGHLRDLLDQALGLREIAPALEVAAAAGRLRLLAGDAEGTSEVDDLLARYDIDSVDVLSRPYLSLALFYAEAGRARSARAWLRAYEREFPPELRGPDRWKLHRAWAAVHRVEGSLNQALTELRLAARAPAIRGGPFDALHIRTFDHPELARVYDELGRADSAVAVYERFLAVRSLSRTTIDAFELANAHDRLGALYERRGDRARAALHYGHLARLWGEADASLQPRVARARRFVAAVATVHPGNR